MEIGTAGRDINKNGEKREIECEKYWFMRNLLQIWQREDWGVNGLIIRVVMIILRL